MYGENDKAIKQAKQLVSRLERISADSIWAHRSSGYRSSLYRLIEQIEQSRASLDTDIMNEPDWALLDLLIQASSGLLERAAREMIK
jgi:hypothetical protein